ncbi:MAG: hypothetical protein ACTS2F_21705 [Thainema sp.]
MDDPLFAISRYPKDWDNAMSSYLGIEADSINRSEIVKRVKYIKSLTPMVAADYVKILPINYNIEPSDCLPIYASENLFSDILPKPIIDFFQENVEINSVRRLDGSPGYIQYMDLQPCREIKIGFKDHTTWGEWYILFENSFESIDGKQGAFRARMHLPDNPPNSEDFSNWVTESFHLSCKKIYDEILWRNIIADRFNASYLAESLFIFNLLTNLFSSSNTIQNSTANILLNMELPFLEDLDIATVMSIRMNNGEEFQNFRVHLEKQFRELRLIEDPHELKLRAENALHELEAVQIQAIEQKIKQIRRIGILDAIVLTGGLLASIQTHSWGFAALSAAVAAARGYKPFVDSSNQVRQNPAFFLWKVLRET